ncbi:MAG: HNH endonuclease [Reyranella sp.]|uniref:HNH endonuclease n=1 Tax=Reyranella sp. TaxID=1929291 RepID=UPI001AC797FA|nr:HNH endonuclease [Reyranella sp.]MBN9085757.1 HNH endonuclease [Reyranella sp.]
MKAVFDTRPGSGYDDEIQTRYHFPDRYLDGARKAIGDWIVYRAPRRGGGKIGYFAAARVVSLDPDPDLPGHSYARMTDFLPFDEIVPLERATGFYEDRLNFVAKRSLIGRTLQGHSVRTISEIEFGEIVRDGLEKTLDPSNAVRLELDAAHADPETLALVNASEEEQERRVVQILMNRKIRDASFRRQVCEAYDNTCAITGLRMVNGGGKAEAQAAHIWSVASGGPDVVQNGLALSATVHWLFDRHLISLTDDYGLLVSHNRVPGELRSLFEQQLQRIRLPKNQALWPRPQYIRQHRATFLG